MKTSDIRLVQTRLATLGLYTGPIDGDRTASTDAAILAGLPKLGVALPQDWQAMSEKRRAVAFLQAMAQSEGIEPGPIDGWWGPQTEFATSALAQKLATGTVPTWRDITPSAANPNGWPVESAMVAFYGPHGQPNAPFPPPPLVKVPSPWTFRLAWNLNQTRNFLWAHQKCAASLGRVLSAIHTHYGEASLRDLSLDVFSGDYIARIKKGSASTWSMHSWGVAYDFDDTHNQLTWGADRARFAQPDYIPWWQIWEAEGWVSLGRSRNFDWMHVQAARLP